MYTQIDVLYNAISYANTDSSIRLACCSVTVCCKSELSGGSMIKRPCNEREFMKMSNDSNRGNFLRWWMTGKIYSVNYSLITNCWLYVSMIQFRNVIHLVQHVRIFRSTIASLEASTMSLYSKYPEENASAIGFWLFTFRECVVFCCHCSFSNS